MRDTAGYLLAKAEEYAANQVFLEKILIAQPL